ncbi:unnamed protein product [Linum trigynum]
MSSFLQDQFQLPTLLPTPTFTCSFPARHLPSLKLSKTTKAVALIITNETLEKMCSIGAVSLLQPFLTEAFNFTPDQARTTMFLYGGITNLVPVLGAVVSDSYLGRFTTLSISTPCSLLAAVLLMLTAFPGMHPRQERKAEAWQMALLYGSFFFFTLAAAGIRSCNLPFGIDQYDLTTEAGQRGKERFVSWNYASFTLSITASVIVIPIVQEITKSWVVGFLIPTCFMMLSCLLFFAGLPLYLKSKPEGSPQVSVLRVFIASFRNRNLPLPSDPNHLFTCPSHGQPAATVCTTNHLRMLEKAAILPAAISSNAGEEEEEGPEITTARPSAVDYHRQYPWRLCSIEQVEDAKSVVKVMLMWAPAIIYQMGASELQGHGYSQAAAMDRKMGPNLKFPAASIGIFSAVALTTWVTVYDNVIVPLARKRRNSSSSGDHNRLLELSILQRMGIGMCISTLAVVVAGIVEGQRRRHVEPTSVFWLVPQLVLLGVAEGFNGVAQIEFYHAELPATMASLTGGFFALGYSFASFAAALLESIVRATTRSPDNKKIHWLSDNGGKLDHHYFVVAGLATLNLAWFLFMAKRYKLRPGAN